MPDITVHPHGDRWAVAEAGAESPTKEFPTREAAELAARQMAQDGAVQVSEEDPTTLGAGHSEGAGEAAGGPALSQGVDAAERARARQGGL
jgi:hypothetical protein